MILDLPIIVLAAGVSGAVHPILAEIDQPPKSRRAVELEQRRRARWVVDEKIKQTLTSRY